ncbi:MAG: flagellar basal body protein FliL [Alphaproteobacteria bacterium]|nr:MAG: flagellar basal body protein FliL [Alphaproteobacteria bacterium]
MADEDDDLLEDAEGEAPVPKRLSGKKIVMIGGAAIVLLALIGSGAMMLFGGGEHEQPAAEEQTGHGEEGGEGEHPAEPEKIEVIFIDLPDMVVNLNTGERQPRYLRAKISIEVDRESSRKAIEEQLPRVLDDFQVYLREMRIEDLNGSAGLYRLKEELLRRLNTTLAPVQVKDVLFREMLVQ